MESQSSATSNQNGGVVLLIQSHWLSHGYAGPPDVSPYHVFSCHQCIKAKLPVGIFSSSKNLALNVTVKAVITTPSSSVYWLFTTILTYYDKTLPLLQCTSTHQNREDLESSAHIKGDALTTTPSRTIMQPICSSPKLCLHTTPHHLKYNSYS
jgi:hypothetical protein